MHAFRRKDWKKFVLCSLTVFSFSFFTSGKVELSPEIFFSFSFITPVCLRHETFDKIQHMTDFSFMQTSSFNLCSGFHLPSLLLRSILILFLNNTLTLHSVTLRNRLTASAENSVLSSTTKNDFSQMASIWDMPVVWQVWRQTAFCGYMSVSLNTKKKIQTYPWGRPRPCPALLHHYKY